MLEAKGINFSYAQKPVLTDVSIEIKSGEFTSVLGANGSGKSTLLKILSGYMRPNSGSVLLDNRDVFLYNARQLAKKRAVLEQDAPLEFNYTVLETVCLGRFAMSSFWGIDSRSKQIAQTALAKVGLSGFENKHYLNLSGGERRRVQLARVISQILENPKGKLLLLDEPTANLDPLYEHLTMALCKEICEMGACCVAVLHSVDLALNYSDKAVLLSNGKVLASGKTSDVISEENISALYNLRCKIINDTQHATIFSIEK